MAHALSSLLPLIRLELPGIPEPVLVDGLNEAVDNFLSDSEVWKYTIPGLLDWEIAQTFPTIATGVEIPAGTRVVRVDTVKYASDGSNLKEVPFRTRQQADSEYPDWEVRTGNSPNIWLTDGLDGGPTAVISPIATADVLTSLKVRVILGSEGAGLTVLPNFIIHEFGDVIRNATLARLMKIPGKDWTDPVRAANYSVMYDADVRKAKSRAEAGFGQPSREMSYGGL